MQKPVFESKQKILRLLRADRFLSGPTLTESLGISRAAIARHIKELQQLGVDIFTVKGKGYRLARPLDLMDSERLAELMLASQVQSALKDAECHVFPMIDSTNQFWLNRASQSPPSGSVCWAEYQSAGRGRRGRSWQSPFSASLYGSVWWQSKNNLSELMGLSVAVGLAVTRWLNKLGAPAQVKWPNDIYLGGKKVAGILVELEAQPDGTASAVVGIGLNVDLPKLVGEQIDQPWTDLKQWLAQLPRRTELAAGLYDAVIDCLQHFEVGGIQSCVSDWDQFDVYAEHPVCLLMGEHRIEGLCKGVDGQGALLLETDAGLRSFFGGELSLRSSNAVG